MAHGDNRAAERMRAAAPALAVHVLLGLVLIYGLAGGDPEAETVEVTRAFDILPDAPRPPVPPPPPPPAPRERAEQPAAPRTAGASAPPNLEARQRPLEAPEPIVPPPLAAPAAPIAGTGAAVSAGAAPVPGPGTGAGGTGNGAGSGSGASGSGGSGPGGGGAEGGGSGSGGAPVGDLTPPRQIAGSLRIQDMPAPLQESGFTGRVGVLYRVEADGRVTHCRITHSSGSTLMDRTTCSLIEQRFRYLPARDEAGRPFAGDMEADHYWESDALAPERRRRGGGD